MLNTPPFGVYNYFCHILCISSYIFMFSFKGCSVISPFVIFIIQTIANRTNTRHCNRLSQMTSSQWGVQYCDKKLRFIDFVTTPVSSF